MADLTDFLKKGTVAFSELKIKRVFLRNEWTLGRWNDNYKREISKRDTIKKYINHIYYRKLRCFILCFFLLFFIERKCLFLF